MMGNNECFYFKTIFFFAFNKKPIKTPLIYILFVPCENINLK